MKCTKIALATLFAGMMVAAVSAENSPYQENFDLVPNGTKATDISQYWSSGANDESVVTNKMNGAAVSEGNVLQINTEGDTLTNNLANPFDITASANGVYMDSMIQFVPSDDLATIAADDTLKLALYAYQPEDAQNATLVVYHSYMDAEYNIVQVSTDTGFVVTTGALQRVVVTLKKVESEDFGLCTAPYAFQVKIGDTIVTSTNAYTEAALQVDYNGTYYKGTGDAGSWFLTANSGSNVDANKKQINSLAFSGTGYVDDINIADVVVRPTSATITFVDEDGTTVLQTGVWDIDAVPSYTNATPTKAADATGIYTFAGWTPAITNVTADATYTATYSSVAAVASVDGTYYATVNEALGAAGSGDTVTLLANCTTGIRVNAGTNVVINLNGYTVTRSDDCPVIMDGGTAIISNGTVRATLFGDWYPAVWVQNAASDITLGDNLVVDADDDDEGYGVYAIAGTVTIDGAAISASEMGVELVTASGTLDSGSVDSDGWGVFVTQGGSFTMNGGEINSVDFAVGNHGTDTTAASATTITINDGELNSDETAVYHPGLGTLTLNGGEINGVDAGVEMRAGDLVVPQDSEVVVTASADWVDPAANGSGSTITGAAIAISQHTTEQEIGVDIQGGEFYAYGEGGKAFYETDTVTSSVMSEGVEISISGGYFEGEVAVESNYVDSFVSGGTFSTAVAAAYCAEGYAPDSWIDPESGATLYGVKPATFTVIFMANEETFATSNNIAYNAQVAAPVPAPADYSDSLSNYVFRAWQLGGVDYVFATGVTSNFTLVAYFTATEITPAGDNYDEVNGDTVAGEAVSAAVAAWLNTKKGAATKADFEANLDNDGLSLTDEYLLNTDPTVNTTVAFSITSIAVGSTVDVNITLTRTEGNDAVTDKINGTLKIKGAAAVAGPYTDDQSLTDKFNGVTTATKSFSTENKFFKAVIE